MIAVIRVRGRTGIKPDAELTLKKLRLTRINHMVIVPEDATHAGMLKRAKDYITWGEIDRDTLVESLKERARLEGRREMSGDLIKETGHASIDELADFVLKGNLLSKVEKMVPVLRLHPPKGGYEFIRRQYNNGGTTGYRGKEINQLIRRMLKPGVDLNGKNSN